MKTITRISVLLHWLQVGGCKSLVFAPEALLLQHSVSRLFFFLSTWAHRVLKGDRLGCSAA